MSDFMSFNTEEFFLYFNKEPSSVKGQANSRTFFYKKQLYRLIAAVFEFERKPDFLFMPWFRFWLFHFGSIGAIYTKEFGYIFNPWSIEKFDFQFKPVVINASVNGTSGVKTGIIGINAEYLHLFDDFTGFEDIVCSYAEQLAQFDKDININLMNCNVSIIKEVKDKKEAEDVYEAYQQATEGRPLVLKKKNSNNSLSDDSDFKNTTLFNDIGNNYIIDKLYVDKRNCLNEFLTKIGIRNANYSKRERLNSQEVNENDDETRALIDVALKNMKDDFKRINALTGWDMDVNLNFSYVSAIENDIMKVGDEV